MSLLTLIRTTLDRKVSKQAPGAGAFWWTRLPARRLHVSQVNKTRGGGMWGDYETEEWDGCKLMVVFLQINGGAWT